MTSLGSKTYFATGRCAFSVHLRITLNTGIAKQVSMQYSNAGCGAGRGGGREREVVVVVEWEWGRRGGGVGGEAGCGVGGKGGGRREVVVRVGREGMW